MRLRTLWLPLIFLALAGCGNEDEVKLNKEPTLFVDRTALLFDTEYGSGTYIGASTFNTLLIENRGEQELQVTAITKQAPGEFTVQLPQDLADGKVLHLASRQQAFVQVTFKPSAVKTYEGSLLIKTNDPQAAEKTIGLTGKGVAKQ